MNANIKGGYTNYGQDIGILMLETIFPRIQGDIGNARTFDFPVKYRVVRNVFEDGSLPTNAEEVLLDRFIKAAKDLESEGCLAITTSCGFLAGFQKELADAVNIPVFTSVLTLIPMIKTMISNNKSIGIFTENKNVMTEFLFNKCGWSSNDINVNISDLPSHSDFSHMIISNHSEGDLDSIKQSIKQMAYNHMKTFPDTGAIVLECQNFSPYGQMIQEICQVPVFGINQMIEFIEKCVRYPFY